VREPDVESPRLDSSARTIRELRHVWSFGARLFFASNAACADHIAAISSIAARRTDVRDIVKHGLTWGPGHTVTLFVFAGAAILLGRAIPEHLARPLETAVGIMLVGLGAHVLWRLWRDRVHFHRHGHGDGTEHIHAIAI
jgi:ABC-type nickel/cobalt efflux system permease component RcnA